MTKRIVIVLMLLALVCGLCIFSFAAGGSLSASGGAACPGNTVTVSFWISGNTEPGIVGAELRGSYDASKLEYVSFSNGSVMGSPVCNVSGGGIYVSWDESLTTGVTGDGVMCTLTFRIREDCTPGQQLSVSVTSFKAHDTDLNDVTFSASGTSVTVKEHSWSTPVYTWSEDNVTCTAVRQQTCGCGSQESETATSTKEENGNSTTYTANFQNPAFQTQTKQVTTQTQPDYISVRFRLIGATLSRLENGVDLSNGGTSDSQYVTWIPTKWHTMDADSTVYDLIVLALNGAGLHYEMSSYYLSSINAPAVLGGYELAELTNGSRSGWMFTVNGTHGQLSIGQQQLQNGDEVIVHYVNDYIYEESKFPWLSAPDVAPVKHEHAYEGVVTAPTCTEEGYTTYTCECGNSYVDEKVEATGHSWDEGVVTLEPTENSAGEKTYTCSVCEQTRKEEIAPLAHTHKYDSVVTEPTCITEGYTTYTCECGDTYVEEKVAATGHSYGEWEQTRAPGYGEEGEDQRKCTACDHYETRIVAALDLPATEPTEPTTPVTPTNPTEPNADEPVSPSSPSADTQVCTCWVCQYWWLFGMTCILVSALIALAVSFLVRKARKEN